MTWVGRCGIREIHSSAPRRIILSFEVTITYGSSVGSRILKDESVWWVRQLVPSIRRRVVRMAEIFTQSVSDGTFLGAVDYGLRECRTPRQKPKKAENAVKVGGCNV